MQGIKYVTGNLLNMLDQFDVVLQGNNCFHTHGAGIAKSFADRYPQIENADLEQTSYGDINKLGTYSKAMVGNTTILNCYTQYYTGRTLKPFDYNAFKRVLKLVKHNFEGKRIGMPMIGCGLAGADEKQVISIIQDIIGTEDVTIVIFDK